MSRIADMVTTGGVYGDALHAPGDILAYLRRADRTCRTAECLSMDGLDEVRATVAGICKEVSELEIEEIYSELVDPDTPPELIEPKSPPRRAGSAS